MANPYPTRGVVVATTSALLYADTEVFPNLLGQDIAVTKQPEWSTVIRKAASGNEVRAAWYPSPFYTFKLKFPFLRHGQAAATLGIISELNQLVSFFNYRRGRYGFFYYLDPTDYQVTTAQTFATGDGATTLFQLQRIVAVGSPYSTIEPVYALWNAPVITVAGVTKVYGTDYTIGAFGAVTSSMFVASIKIRLPSTKCCKGFGIKRGLTL
jgi:uncharacterized protein (TIGR02217 family)